MENNWQIRVSRTNGGAFGVGFALADWVAIAKKTDAKNHVQGLVGYGHTADAARAEAVKKIAEYEKKVKA